MWRIAILFVVMLLMGCAKNEKVELTISAAASLIDALQDIQREYEKTHDHIKLNFNFSASGALQQQIEQGAPVDLFISAATKNMNALIEKNLIDETYHKNLLQNELVVVTPFDGRVVIHELADLKKEEIKHLAIGEPATVPAGSYAQESLTNANLWAALEHKIVFGKDVRQVLTYVETGNTEAGVVYKTDALSSSNIEIAFVIDPAFYESITYPVGIVKSTNNKKETSDFFTYLTSKEALDLFQKYGFSVPK